MYLCIRRMQFWRTSVLLAVLTETVKSLRPASSGASGLNAASWRVSASAQNVRELLAAEHRRPHLQKFFREFLRRVRRLKQMTIPVARDRRNPHPRDHFPQPGFYSVPVAVTAPPVSASPDIFERQVRAAPRSLPPQSTSPGDASRSLVPSQRSAKSGMHPQRPWPSTFAATASMAGKATRSEPKPLDRSAR